jgi:hypothetical protein
VPQLSIWFLRASSCKLIFLGASSTPERFGVAHPNQETSFIFFAQDLVLPVLVFGGDQGSSLPRKLSSFFIYRRNLVAPVETEYFLSHNRVRAVSMDFFVPVFIFIADGS